MNNFNPRQKSDGLAIEFGEEHDVVATTEEPLGPLPPRHVIEEVRRAKNNVNVARP